MTLLEEYKKKQNNKTGNDQNKEMEVMLAADHNEESVDREITELQDKISEKLVEDVNKWPIDEEEESVQIMTDDELIEDVTSREEKEEGNRREETSSLYTISNNAAMNTFATSVKWAEEN
ncbi:hypothetical protein J6590_079584 [Homalodisca vitripennis]|nr:hypothetical protein J6590_079584 [Homalodisca vitripennis]